MISSARNIDTISVTFPTVAEWTYTFESSTDLVSWEFIPEIRIGDGNPLTVTFGGASRYDRLFIRARVGP